MRNFRLISTTAAIVLLGAGAVAAQGVKTDDTRGVPAAQQSAPAEKIAPAGKSDLIKAPEKTGQVTPMAPDAANKQQTTDKGADKSAPAGTAAKGSADVKGSATDAKGSADVSADATSKRTARHGGGRYASSRHGPFYDSYRGDLGYSGCRSHRHHGWTPWLWC